MDTTSALHFLSAQRLTIKGIIVAFLILFMLIPAIFIMNLVSERADRQQAVAKEVSSRWATNQTFTGPLLVIPYRESVKTDDGKTTVYKKYAYFLPDLLKINGELQPQIRHRSIYDIVVYRTDMQVEGHFSPVSTQLLNIPEEDLQLHEAFVCIGLTDFRGIEDQLSLLWNETSAVFNAGMPDDRIIKNGLHTPVAIGYDDLTRSNTFKLQLHLRGSENLSFTPVGKTTNVNITSAWTNPSFDGSFLPVHTPEINDNGFSAGWKVQHLNRSYPQSWKDGNYNVADSKFGITLLQPVDSYAKTMRSVKYAILFIALTFGLYFFLEVLQKRTVHPIQYVLVGLALSIFYTLLLSISEYTAFNIAYSIAASATVALITLYTKSIFHQWKIAALFGALLTVLYTFIFVLLQLRDGALLFGSIGLFILLAAAMYYSRKINWYGQLNQ
ncbi:cell envelope integrity protein CreD [Agriterribacter sp.]|uniref:cell envelope integrity protein CreD n=1 Tax=Agriterribacter sp. TaxID=2821509 RepID=UPI002BFCC59D|nr:cell envelope integrity protein CreD [Agriterribacter sp.]HRO46175.1 cell envelope integrity protein CreD [Agriterribacter sp.]HRQ16289.1 cell envelope integrity protein CreD [Agriterribacter sp.]